MFRAGLSRCVHSATVLDQSRGQPMSEGQPKPLMPQNAAAGPAPAPQANEADRCLQCNRQAPGARYRFWVARRHRLSRHIVHEETTFLCDRCAGARLRFAPRVALLLWVPVLALLALFACRRVATDFGLPFTAEFGMRTGR